MTTRKTPKSIRPDGSPVSRGGDRGFALVVTLSLMVLLTIMAVGLLSLSAISLRSTTGAQAGATARANARLALMLALGDLQKRCGPDQRVTARSDLAVAAAANPFYAGVWDTAAATTAAGDARTRDAAIAASSKLDPAAPLAWLVSGNESNPIAIGPGSSFAAATSVTLVKPQGTGTTGQVVVVKVPMKSGNYAWWVGDEGVKAKLNVTDRFSKRPAVVGAPAFTPTTLQSYYQTLSSQRNGIETVLDASGNAIGGNYNPTANTVAAANLMRDLNKSVTYASGALLAGFDEPLLRARFHDLSAYSMGLLTNTAHGGLRKDLSWQFAQSDATDGLDRSLGTTPPYPRGILDLPSQKDSRLSPINPTWQALKGFYKTSESVVSGAPLDAVLPDVNNYTSSINPTVVQARFYAGFDADASGIYVNTYLAVLLTNPYNYPVKSGQIRFTFGTRASAGTSDPLNPPGSTSYFRATVTKNDNAPVAGATIAKIFSDSGRDPISSDSELSGSFITPQGVVFAPGEMKVFSLANANVARGAVDIPLMEGLNISNSIRTMVCPPASDWTKVKVEVRGTYTLTATDKASNKTIWSCGYVAMPGVNRILPVTANPFMAGGITSFLKLPSQPGGVSNESIRFLADFDMRLPGQGGPAQPNTSPMYRAFSTFPGNSSFSDDLTRAPGDTDPLRWGPAVSDSIGQPKVALFDVPRLLAGSPAGWPALVSLGQLQHAHVGTRPWHPSYIIGNSYASLFTQRDKTVSLQTVPSGWIRDDKFYDLSYLLNESLWDRYYFSSVPQPPALFAPATDLLANRYLPIASDAGIPLTQAVLTQNAFSAAAHLLVDGAFNVNSTSDQAWRAVFATFRGLDQNGETNLSGPFLRTPHQTGASSTSNTGTSSNAWAGFRNLSDSEIADLAREMVKQVRLRGPFRSLADFVNRRLMDPAADPNQLGLRGALQAAIDAAGINGNFPNANNNTETSYTSLPACSQMHPNNAVGNRATGAPGWLMQADLLQALAPVLTARSDTFVIRAYGEALSPDGLTVLAKSWCEAVVQRLPEFLDPLNPPDALVTALNPTNQMFGRRFKMIQFRWLNANET